MTGRSTMVSISFGIALVAGRKRVPRPATGRTAFRRRGIDRECPFVADVSRIVVCSTRGMVDQALTFLIRIWWQARAKWPRSRKNPHAWKVPLHISDAVV